MKWGVHSLYDQKTNPKRSPKIPDSYVLSHLAKGSACPRWSFLKQLEAGIFWTWGGQKWGFYPAGVWEKKSPPGDFLGVWFFSPEHFRDLFTQKGIPLPREMAIMTFEEALIRFKISNLAGLNQ